MPRARTKPVEVEYLQWDGRNYEEVEIFVGKYLVGVSFISKVLTVYIQDNDGDCNKQIILNLFDYLIKYEGEIEGCTLENFEEIHDFPID